MSFGNAWSRLFPRNSSRISRLRRWFRLRLEHLEDRTLPSVSQRGICGHFYCEENADISIAL